MNESSRSTYLPGEFTDSDWQLIAASLLKSGSPHAAELSKAIVGWRIEVARSREGFLRAFAAVHHK